MSRIIISYRKNDAKSIAGRLHDTLCNTFGEQNVRLGVGSLIEPGDDYLEVIEQKVGNCNVLLLLIGPNWLSTRWIDDGDDYDVLGIRAALNGGRRIIPLLVEGSEMPSDLPPDMARLAQRVGLTIADDTFRDDAAKLLATLQKIVEVPTPAAAMTPAPPAYAIPAAPPPIVYEPPRRETLLGKERAILKGIDATAFQHPFDKAATENLRKIKGFDTVVGKFMEFGVERYQYYVNMANSVRVSPRQFAPIYEMLTTACQILDMPEPETYVFGSPIVNAYTYGHNRPYIILYAGLIDRMNEDELFAVIAHELGHIKCGHVLYRTMAIHLGDFMSMIADFTLGIGNLLGLGLRVAMMSWYRRSELSADRAALLTTQDPAVCISMLAKLAGGTNTFAEHLDPEQFLEQARQYNEDDSNLDRFYRFLVSLDLTTHPFPIERAKHLNDWIDTPEYDQILAGNYARQLQTRGGACPNCGSRIRPDDRFCPMCGRPTTGA